MKKLASILASAGLAGVLALTGTAPAAAQSSSFSFGFGTGGGNWDYCDRHPSRCDDDWDGWRDWDDRRDRWRWRHRNRGARFGVFPSINFSVNLTASQRRSWAAHVDRCEARYKSYDPETDMFLGYDGDYHRCRL